MYSGTQSFDKPCCYVGVGGRLVTFPQGCLLLLH